MSDREQSAAIQYISGTALPLTGDDIDTDQIIESRYLRLITFDGIESYLFESACAEARKASRVHPFDNPTYRNASLLLVNSNFGCGSSREHAAQALRRRGIKAIVGQSFGEIFAGNCLALGMPAVVLERDNLLRLQTMVIEEPSLNFELDLATCRLTANSESVSIGLPAGRRQRLLDGRWDPLVSLLLKQREIEKRIATLPPLGDLR